MKTGARFPETATSASISKQLWFDRRPSLSFYYRIAKWLSYFWTRTRFLDTVTALSKRVVRIFSHLAKSLVYTCMNEFLPPDDPLRLSKPSVPPLTMTTEDGKPYKVITERAVKRVLAKLRTQNQRSHS